MIILLVPAIFIINAIVLFLLQPAYMTLDQEKPKIFWESVVWGSVISLFVFLMMTYTLLVSDSMVASDRWEDGVMMLICIPVFILSFLTNIVLKICYDSKLFPLFRNIQEGISPGRAIFLIKIAGVGVVIGIFLLISRHKRMVEAENGRAFLESLLNSSRLEAVSDIRYDTYSGWVGKDSARWLKFTCSDKAVVERLIRMENLITSKKCSSSNPFSAPSWWNLPDGDEAPLSQSTQSYYNYDHDHSKIELCYDPAIQVVFYERFGM